MYKPMLLTLAKVLLICSAIQSLNNSHLAFGFSVKIRRETNYTLQFNQYSIHTNCKSSCWGRSPNHQHSEFMHIKHSIPLSNYKDVVLVIPLDWNELFYSGRVWSLLWHFLNWSRDSSNLQRGAQIWQLWGGNHYFKWISSHCLAKIHSQNYSIHRNCRCHSLASFSCLAD